ncbi:MAG: prolipoprotein diacylglyceryl transferase [Planctomycetota bacterium]
MDNTMPLMPQLADAWVHDLDPFLLRLTSWIGIRWYGLAYLAGFAIGYWLLRRIAKTGQTPLTPDRVPDLVVCIVVGVLVGGRLGYVVFYEPALFITWNSSRFPWWGLPAINWGGMASHGGMIGGIVACIWFGRRRKMPSLHLIDLMAIGAPLGLFLGRVTNFINGELFGRECKPDFALAVKFPEEMKEWPVERLLEAQYAYLAASGARETVRPEFFDNYAIEQIQLGNTAMVDAIAPLLTPRHPSQLYAAVLEGLVVFAVLFWLYRKPRTAGVIGGAFGITYGLMRIVNEFFRRPDLQLLDDEFQATREAIGFGISRGQWLSVLLIAAGVTLLIIARKRGGDPLGGWRKLA